MIQRLTGQASMSGKREEKMRVHFNTLIILIFLRSLRKGNFDLYKDSLAMLIPWFFALDHPNYARWLPIHVRDMMALDRIAPSVAT